MSTSVDNDKLLVPDYEAHYQELLSKLREQAAYRPKTGRIILGLRTIDR